MKFEIQQEDFQKALDVIAGVVPTKTTLPILTCVLMEAADGRLTLSATNLDISITTMKTHRKRAYRKLNISSQSELLSIFLRSIEPYPGSR